MNDFLPLFEQYKDIKEVGDLIDEIKKLRLHYNAQQYDAMQQHIQSLTAKYLVETITWNSTHQTMPTTAQQSYLNADSFLRMKGLSVLIKKGIKAVEHLTNEETALINSTIKPQE